MKKLTTTKILSPPFHEAQSLADFGAQIRFICDRNKPAGAIDDFDLRQMAHLLRDRLALRRNSACQFGMRRHRRNTQPPLPVSDTVTDQFRIEPRLHRQQSALNVELLHREQATAERFCHEFSKLWQVPQCIEELSPVQNKDRGICLRLLARTHDPLG